MKLPRFSRFLVNRLYSLVLFFCLCLYVIHQFKATTSSKKEDVFDLQRANLPVFIIIVCKSVESEEELSSYKRQLSQVEVLLKSAIALSFDPLRFLVVADNEVFMEIEDLTSTWPAIYRDRLLLERREVVYPENRKNLALLKRPCSSARIFIPDELTDIDAAVFLDTDVFFLRPPEELFAEIYKFNDKQITGLVQMEHNMVKARRFPWPRPDGVNTGVLVANLTRMRSLSGGWASTLMDVYDRHSHKFLSSVTNDLFNALIGENMDYLYRLDCTWNYYRLTCWKGYNRCEDAEEKGISLMHGISGTFTNNQETVFKAGFDAWVKYSLGDSIDELINSIKTNLQQMHRGKCTQINNMFTLYTKSLQRH